MAEPEVIATDRIDPQIRPPIEAPRYPSAADAFQAGNYPVALAMSRDTDPELNAMATIMCGAVRPGLERLTSAGISSDEARQVKAYGDWCLGRENNLATEFSADAGEPIDVLVFTMPNGDKGGAFMGADGFNVQNLQLTPDRFGVSLEALLTELPAGFFPRFAVGIDCYGPYLPAGLYEAEFPVAFWVGDHDFFLATRCGDLSRADVIIANSAGEHGELKRCYGTRVAAFPGHDTYAQDDVFSDPPVDPTVDILFTGRAFTPYMADKAQQLFRLACLDDPDLRIEIFDGYFDEDAFITKIRSAKSVPLFWRYGGGIQTRAIDVLRHGVPVLSPEAGLCQALLGSAATDYHLIGTEQPEIEAAEYLTDLAGGAGPSDQIRREEFKDLFWPSPRREERFLKFCLYQTLSAGEERYGVAAASAVPVELRGYEPDKGVGVYTAIMKRNMGAPESAAHFNFAGAAGFYAAILAQNNQKLGELSLEFFAEGVGRFPLNAVLIFNYARALWTFGRRDDACRQFECLIEEGIPWDYDARADALLSHRVRVLSEMFPYGAYYRAAVDAPADAAALNMIIAGAHTYLAEAVGISGESGHALDHLEAATELNPVHFPAYRLKVLVLKDAADGTDDLLAAFYSAVNLYPPLLFDLLSYGVDAELSRRQADEATDILRKFILAHHRLSLPDGSALAVAEESKQAIRRHRPLLDDWTGQLADDMMAAGRL